jgi:hypothetical protein
MAKPILDGRAWVGYATASGKGFTVEFCESKKHPGYYFYAKHCSRENCCDETKRPIKAEALSRLLDNILKPLGLAADEFKWTEAKPADLILLVEKVSAGD